VMRTIVGDCALGNTFQGSEAHGFLPKTFGHFYCLL
jgi:hypothetical protein